MSSVMPEGAGTGSTSFPIQVVEINGQVYVQVEEGRAVDELGLSTVKAMEKMMPPPDLPQPPLPGYVLVDINTFIKAAAGIGALSGVNQTGGGSVIDPEAFGLAINNDIHKIILSVLTSWSNSVQEQAKESKKADLLEGIKREEDKHTQLISDIREGQIKAVEAYKTLLESGQATQPVFVMGALSFAPVVMAGFVGGTISPLDKALGITVRTVSEVGGSEVTSQSIAAGYIGATMMYGVQVLANLSRLGAQRQTKIDEKVPEEYGKKMLKFVTSPDADVLLKAAAGPGKEGEEAVALVKVAMLVLPLMLSYRFETGGTDIKGREGMTSHEMKSLLLQEFKDIPETDIKSQLAAAIQQNLAQISTPVKALLIERILAYVDSKPPLGDLLDGQKAIEQIKAVEETSVETFGV